MITKELIEKFFNQQCNATEANHIVKYFDENPENLAEYLNTEEWDSFKDLQKLPPEKTARLWNAVYKEVHPQLPVIYYLKKIAVAASILFVLGAAGFLLFRPTKSSHTIAKVENKTAQKIAVNSGEQKISLYLSDSTFIELMPGSILSYPEVFSANKRDVVLKGEAYFSIAKDNARPFTVYSDDIATTALGTKFSVQAFAKENNIRVVLFEGKVVVRPADSIQKTLKTDMYLLPGDALLYSRSNQTAIVTHSSKSNIATNTISKSNRSQSAGLTGNNWYMFNNQSLAEVFDQLGILYNQKITYSRSDIQGMTFIGKLDNTDSLENILNSIALLNNLKVSKNTGGYVIKKK